MLNFASMKNRRRSTLFLSFYLFIGSTPIYAAESARPLVIGTIMAYSGPASVVTLPHRAGFDLAAKEINDAGGLLGRKIKLVHRDDKLDPTEAQKAATDLVLNEKVDFLMGGLEGSICGAISQVAKEKKVFFMASMCTPDFVTADKGHRLIARGFSTNTPWARSLAQRAVKQYPDVARWVILAPNSHFGREQAEIFKKEMMKLKPSVKFQKEIFTQTFSQDFTATITALMASNGQAIFSALWGGDAITFAKQAKPFKLFSKMKMVGCCSLLDEQFVALGKDAPIGTLGTGFPFYDEHMLKELPLLRGWMEAYKKVAAGQPLNPTAIGGYQSMKLLGEGIKKAGSFEAEKVAAAFDQGFEVDYPWGKATLRGCDHQLYPAQFTGVAAWDDKRQVAYLSESERVFDLQNAIPCEEIKKRRASAGNVP